MKDEITKDTQLDPEKPVETEQANSGVETDQVVVEQVDETEVVEKPTETDEKFDLQKVLEIPEVKDFVQKVRKQEKDKLYGELQKRDAKIKELDTELKTAQEAVKNTEKSSNDVTGGLQSKVEALTKAVDELTKENRRKELELYRNNALKDAGDDLILDLVRGDTEEEITQSIGVAKTKYQEIIERATAKKKGSVPTPTNPQQTPTVKQLTNEEIAKLTPAEWAQHREMIKKQLGLKK